jgi:AcrR family transcriptional regulator
MHPENSKRQLTIQAAIEIFSKSNFRDSTISEIAGKANIAEGVLARSLNLEKRKEFRGRL